MREAGDPGDVLAQGTPKPGQRAFDVQAPDLLWVTYITYITEHPTEEGKLYCAAVLDCFFRRIIGHSIDIRQTTELVVYATTATVARGKPAKDATILHSDNGTQFTS